VPNLSLDAEMDAMPSLREDRPSITRKDVADHAGVSTAVVSYVVNEGPRNVAPATRARVLESISSLGYRPNAAARALKLGVSELVGLVLSDTANPYFAEFSRAIEKAATDKGLSVIFTNSALVQGQEHLQVQKLVARQVDGLLLGSTEDPTSTVPGRRMCGWSCSTGPNRLRDSPASGSTFGKHHGSPWST
jgi:hypothetical protein